MAVDAGIELASDHFPFVFWPSLFVCVLPIAMLGVVTEFSFNHGGDGGGRCVGQIMLVLLFYHNRAHGYR